MLLIIECTEVFVCSVCYNLGLLLKPITYDKNKNNSCKILTLLLVNQENQQLWFLWSTITHFLWSPISKLFKCTQPTLSAFIFDISFVLDTKIWLSFLSVRHKKVKVKDKHIKFQYIVEVTSIMFATCNACILHPRLANNLIRTESISLKISMSFDWCHFLDMNFLFKILSSTVRNSTGFVAVLVEIQLTWRCHPLSDQSILNCWFTNSKQQ